MKNEIKPPFEGKSWLQLAIDMGDCPDDAIFELVMGVMGDTWKDKTQIKKLASEIRANALREVLQFLPKDKDSAVKMYRDHERSMNTFGSDPRPHPMSDMLGYLIESLDWKR